MKAKEHALAFEYGYANLGGVRLHYAKGGNGEQLVLLLHGFPECWYSWRHQLSALSERYTVVAPDMRGFNLSDKPGRVSDYRLERLTEDVVRLVEHFGRSKAAIVGHDMGALVAWAVASRYPACVWKLAVLQVPPPSAWWANLTVRQFCRSWHMLFLQIPLLPEAILRRASTNLIHRIFDWTSAQKGAFSRADIAFYKRAISEPGAARGAINYYRANILDIAREQVSGKANSPRIVTPLLFIYGEQDPCILPTTVSNIAAYVDGPYREVRIPSSGHWVQQEAAQEVNCALIDFLGA
jgi:pimeloyl-ACP methyl ester carboxylesterase